MGSDMMHWEQDQIIPDLKSEIRNLKKTNHRLNRKIDLLISGNIICHANGDYSLRFGKLNIFITKQDYGEIKRENVLKMFYDNINDTLDSEI